jgi:gas vesicle protein
MESSNGKAFGWFLAGALLGAGVALLVAPESGDRTRRKLIQTTERGGKSLLEQGQEFFERGRELYERGLEIAEEAAELFEKGRRLVERRINEQI